MIAERSNPARVVRLAAVLLVAAFLAGSHDADAGGPAGWHWQPYSDGLPAYALVVTVAVQPGEPSAIYAGSYEPPGVWRSADGGQSWQLDDQGLEGSPVFCLHWDAARRQWWAGTRDGLYTRPAGSGASWRAAALSGQPVYAIAADGRGRLYAAAEGGLFRTSDGGTWASVPLPADAAKTAILAVAASLDGRTLLAGTAGQGLWVSRNGGGAWSQARTDAGPLPGYVTAVLLVTTSDGAAYASTSERAYRSADGGATWEPITALEGRVHAFAAAPDGSLYAALTGRVARSSDGGRTWEIYTAGLRPGDKVLDLALVGSARVYAAAWDGIYASNDGGRQWERLKANVGYPDVNTLTWDGWGNLLAGTRSEVYRRSGQQGTWKPIAGSRGRGVLTFTDAGNGRDFYAGLSGGLARSTDAGRSWTEVPSELSEHGLAGIVVDPADPNHLIAWIAFGRVHESRDGGRTWVARWEGLGTVRPVTAIHRAETGDLYAGAEDGLFRWEPDRGAWLPLPLPLVAPTVFAIASDTRDRRVLYIGATDGIWRSLDRGATWSRWGQGLEGVTVSAIAISPADRLIAFAGTRHAGLYRTADGGATWEPAWEGVLATASVRHILFSRDGRAVYVASDRGIWRGGSDGAP